MDKDYFMYHTLNGFVAELTYLTYDLSKGVIAKRYTEDRRDALYMDHAGDFVHLAQQDPSHFVLMHKSSGRVYRWAPSVERSWHPVAGQVHI